ncbi:MAG: CRISPR-associated endoribonuclease Cas6 [Pyrobaculum sp.]|jgi:CRISPR-associated endoribonuclease Cas6
MEPPVSFRLRYITEGPLTFTRFTGTVVLSALATQLGEWVHDERPRPLSVTPIFYRGRPVVDKAAVAPGEELEFRIGVATAAAAEKILAELRDLVLFGQRLVLKEMEFRHAYTDLPETQCFKIEFLTPLRFATPPLMRRKKPVFEFTPRPLTLFKSVIKHARQFGLIKLGVPFLKWVYTYVAMTDFGCYGKCVKTIKLANGGVARGFTGWALYRAYSARRVRDMWKALRLVETFNVGTGRAMGLGVARVTPLQCPPGGAATTAEPI